MKKIVENNLHTFVICAYKEQPYLDECVKSLLNQTLKSKIIISTSTPNDFIKGIAKKYSVELAINTKTKGHINDFCFAYEQTHTKYVTLCHQDDIYYPEFGEMIVRKMEKYKQPIIGFSNYNERRNGKTIKSNLLLKVKRIINFPLLLFGKFKFARMLNLSFGNAICAPSVTYNKEIVKAPLIHSDLKANIDWITYIEFAKEKGSFVYVSKPIMEHRIHEESTTTAVIQNNIMREEDYLMFRKFWPKPIAKFLTNIYCKSEDSNELNKKKKGDKSKMKIIMIAIYLFLTISGLILYKKGTNEKFLINFSNGALNIKLSVMSILGLLCYLCSFLIYMFILPMFDLTYIMPLMSAFSSISIYVLSILVLNESVTAFGILGMIVIVIGVLMINIKK